MLSYLRCAPYNGQVFTEKNELDPNELRDGPTMDRDWRDKSSKVPETGPEQFSPASDVCDIGAPLYQTADETMTWNAILSLSSLHVSQSSQLLNLSLDHFSLLLINPSNPFSVKLYYVTFFSYTICNNENSPLLCVGETIEEFVCHRSVLIQFFYRKAKNR